MNSGAASTPTVGPEGACRSRHLCRPSKRRGAVLTKQLPRRLSADCWKRTHAVTPFGPSTGYMLVVGPPATRLLAELQTGPSKRASAPAEAGGDLAPTQALYAARVAPYPALARGAICRPFVIVRRVVQVRLHRGLRTA